jgi:ATP synthase protein I
MHPLLYNSLKAEVTVYRCRGCAGQPRHSGLPECINTSVVPKTSNSKPAAEKKEPEGMKILVEAEKLMQIALILPSAVFVGWLPGAWLDLHLHQSWMAPVGMVFGGISGMVCVFRMVTDTGKRIEKQMRADAKKEKSSGHE